jgi:hypothetical protein
MGRKGNKSLKVGMPQPEFIGVPTKDGGGTLSETPVQSQDIDSSATKNKNILDDEGNEPNRGRN